MRSWLQFLVPWHKPRPRVAVLRLSGIIGSGGRLASAGLSLSSLAGPIERAFSIQPLLAVALVINSPGGSAAQSHLIFKRIRSFAAKKKIPVLAFVEDVAASGGYMLACAADEIYADESSILGSIGVLSAGFGFTGLLAKLGVERRLHTAGAHKAALDSFLPEDPGDVARLETLQHEVHQSFIALVKERRGARLKSGEELFTGNIWAGGKASELGLIDGIGDMKTLIETRFGDKVKLVAVTPERGFLRRQLGFGAAARPSAAVFAEEALGALEERALWARFGL